MLPVPAGAEGLYILASLFSLPKKKKKKSWYIPLVADGQGLRHQRTSHSERAGGGDGGGLIYPLAKRYVYF